MSNNENREESKATLYTIEGPSSDFPGIERGTATTLSESTATLLERWKESDTDRKDQTD